MEKMDGMDEERGGGESWSRWIEGMEGWMDWMKRWMNRLMGVDVMELKKVE